MTLVIISFCLYYFVHCYWFLILLPCLTSILVCCIVILHYSCSVTPFLAFIFFTHRSLVSNKQTLCCFCSHLLDIFKQADLFFCVTTPFHFLIPFQSVCCCHSPVFESLWRSLLSSPLLRCVGAGNVWKGQHKETKERRKKPDTAIYRSVTSLLCIMLCFPGMSTQLHPPGRQCSQKSSLFGVCFIKSGPGRRYTFSRSRQGSEFMAGKGPDEGRAGSRREKEVTRLQPRAGDLLVSAE